jgi:hypothetical protein
MRVRQGSRARQRSWAGQGMHCRARRAAQRRAGQTKQVKEARQAGRVKQGKTCRQFKAGQGMHAG